MLILRQARLIDRAQGASSLRGRVKPPTDQADRPAILWIIFVPQKTNLRVLSARGGVVVLGLPAWDYLLGIVFWALSSLCELYGLRIGLALSGCLTVQSNIDKINAFNRDFRYYKERTVSTHSLRVS